LPIKNKKKTHHNESFLHPPVTSSLFGPTLHSFCNQYPVLPSGSKIKFPFPKKQAKLYVAASKYSRNHFIYEKYNTAQSSLISFKKVPLFNYALLPATVKGLETFLKPF
jgi:hypothetical protein